MVVKINGIEVNHCMDNLSSHDHLTELACDSYNIEYHEYQDIAEVFHSIIDFIF